MHEYSGEGIKQKTPERHAGTKPPVHAGLYLTCVVMLPPRMRRDASFPHARLDSKQSENCLRKDLLRMGGKAAESEEVPPSTILGVL